MCIDYKILKVKVPIIFFTMQGWTLETLYILIKYAQTLLPSIRDIDYWHFILKYEAFFMLLKLPSPLRCLRSALSDLGQCYLVSRFLNSRFCVCSLKIISDNLSRCLSIPVILIVSISSPRPIKHPSRG